MLFWTTNQPVVEETPIQSPLKKTKKMFQSVDQRERERDIQKLGIKIKEKSKPFTSIFVKKRNA